MHLVWPYRLCADCLAVLYIDWDAVDAVAPLSAHRVVVDAFGSLQQRAVSLNVADVQGCRGVLFRAGMT